MSDKQNDGKGGCVFILFICVWVFASTRPPSNYKTPCDLIRTVDTSAIREGTDEDGRSLWDEAQTIDEAQSKCYSEGQSDDR